MEVLGKLFVFIPLWVLRLLRWNSVVKSFVAGTVMEAGNCRTIAESKRWLCNWDCMFLTNGNFTEKEQSKLIGA